VGWWGNGFFSKPLKRFLSLAGTGHWAKATVLKGIAVLPKIDLGKLRPRHHALRGLG